MSNLQDNAIRALDEIERIEARSLSWGYVDGSFDYDELEQLCGFATSTEQFAEIHELLLGQSLLFEVRAGSQSIRYRSRFAEGVRLLSQLRQLFPTRSPVTAPRLVSDFRIDLRKRHFPARETSPDSALERLRHLQFKLTSLQIAAWNDLTGGVKLSGFQVRGLERVFSSSDGDGTIITAGTGSGKTLAFYLPALLRIIEHISLRDRWVKCLSIYPRRELLKDQFSEVFMQTRLLDASLKSDNKPIVRLGALFGDTPRDAEHAQSKWRKHDDGVIFPGMGCPIAGCGAALVWIFTDMRRKVERLQCIASTCSYSTPDCSIALTRESMIEDPPDVLFTTTEMLNQRLSDPRLRRLFGIDMPYHQKPLFALLDEVHTYVDVHGAQSALTLRRFRHSLNRSIPFVGLSATLAEADRFFAELVGFPTNRVAEIHPFSSELLYQGSEYQVLLSSDPSASTLSTSIQTAMLMGRLMDNPSDPISKGVFGERVFVFTDDLDVTNRLFDDLKDAEAYDLFGHPDPAREPLAALRDKRAATAGYDSIGQRWRLCEAIDRPLGERLILGRTTSQDGGVNTGADVIVATASLEVGYNDASIGAVLQHKAPRNAASFLQRKGRAGRTRKMRPLTVTVLSEYGRDRLAFQGYEHLFDPALPAQSLPVRNDFVLRIQATYSLIDFLSSNAKSVSKSWLWAALSTRFPVFSSARQSVVSLLNRILDADSDEFRALASWLEKALDVDSEIIDRLLWQPPRSMMLEAIPTLLRRLNANWKLANRDGDDELVEYHPLPDFMPRSLFGELNLPEVQIMLPAASVKETSRQESMPIERALSQFAPGNVTRRFGVERGALSHWFAVSWGPEDQVVKISDYCREREDLGFFSDGEGSISVTRPLTVAVSRVKRSEILPTSRSRLVWRSELIARGDSVAVEIPQNSVWNQRLGESRFHLHRFRAAVIVRRFAHEAIAELHRSTERTISRIRFVSDDNEPAGIGFEFDADGLYFNVLIPSADDLTNSLLSPSLLASTRSAYFRWRILTDQSLPFELTSFHRDWIHRLLFCAGLRRAEKTKEELSLAIIAALSHQTELDSVLTELLRESSPDMTSSSLDDESAPNGVEESVAARVSKLHASLEIMLGRKEIYDRLIELIPEISNPNRDDWNAWLRTSLLDSLGEAALQACTLLAPRQISTDTLVVDIRETADDAAPQVWITETTIGGAGVIQAIADIVAADPRALVRAIESVLAPSELEVAADGLDAYASGIASTSNVTLAAAAVRSAVGHVEREHANVELRKALSSHGLHLSRALSISLQARFFRPGSGPQLDRTLQRLIEAWDSLEARLHVSIGARDFSFVAAANHNLATDVISLAPDGLRQGGTVADIIFQLLWPRGTELRQRSLQSYSRYRSTRFVDPALIRELLINNDVTGIDIDTLAWRDELVAALSRRGIAILQAKLDTSLLRSRIIEAIATPVSIGFLRFYPMVERIERTASVFRATLVIKEHF